MVSRSDTHERQHYLQTRSPPELILPGVNINGSGDGLAIRCRCCWTMGTECYHTFPVFSLASNTNNLCLPPFPNFTYLERALDDIAETVHCKIEECRISTIAKQD
jgi:hypothetical protein